MAWMELAELMAKMLWMSHRKCLTLDGKNNLVNFPLKFPNILASIAQPVNKVNLDQLVALVQRDIRAHLDSLDIRDDMEILDHQERGKNGRKQF
jgi:hypothetical protein